ncbi:MAG: CBS domain-containing protein [Isosphaeraceae bacterium]|jgi:CBS domain-containing protein
MTTSVVTVDKMTPYKEIAARMAKHKISTVPVLILGRHVAGVASEAWALIVPRRLPDLAAHPLTP